MLRVIHGTYIHPPGVSGCHGGHFVRGFGQAEARPAPRDPRNARRSAVGAVEAIGAEAGHLGDAMGAMGDQDPDSKKIKQLEWDLWTSGYL